MAICQFAVVFAGFAWANSYNLRQVPGHGRVTHNMDVSMRSRRLFTLLLLLVLLPAVVSFGIDNQRADVFIGQDLRLSGAELTSYQPSSGEHTLVFRDGFSMSIGGNQFSGEKAVVWLKSVVTEFAGRTLVDYDARVYMTGDVSVKKGPGALTVDLSQAVVEDGQAMMVRFVVSGEVFVTADKREIADPRGTELYKRAAAHAIPTGPVFYVHPQARVPGLVTDQARPQEAAKEPLAEDVGRSEFIEEVMAREEQAGEAAEPAGEAEAKEPQFRYPVNLAPAGVTPLDIASAKAADGTDITTVIGRVYLWQKQDEKGGLMELQADNAVVFQLAQPGEEKDEAVRDEGALAGGDIKAVYLSGDVVMTEGPRTIRADELYYDFQKKQSLVINAVMRNFDTKRGIPIYVRAVRLRQVAENKFAAENVTLTSSEFYKPQISATASTMIITDTTALDQQQDNVTDSSYDAEMRKMRLKMGKRTVFYWPVMRGNMQRPDIPIKSVSVGNDNTWGTSVETRWHLSRLLGLREPEGVDTTLALDYFGKRGAGTGVEIDYQKEDYYGRILGYVIRDAGDDRLGRSSTRKDVDPGKEIRGRFSWLHRQFLPYGWQLTTGVGYASDENFIEGYYRGEFNVGTGQETYIHLRRLQDNWGVSLLGKGRINDFSDYLEELPTAEFHLTGQSLFDDKFTFYSDTQIGRLRQRIGEDHTIAIDEDFFGFVSHRAELDMPLSAGEFKVVPFVAGTFGYDDRSGFTQTLVNGSDTGEFGDDKVWLGETGVRLSSQYWNVYPDIKSRLWDLNQLRHIIRPRAAAAFYFESDSVVEQRDTLNIGLSQRLQTKRGPAEEQRTVDWMRLDIDFTFVDNPEDVSDSGPGADRFIWNRPIVPLRKISVPDIYNGDFDEGLQKFEMFGPRRNYFSADYIWRLSDTTSILSDMNYDLQSSVVQQFNIGLTRLFWPNLSYYIGSRYLRRLEILDEKGSNAFTFAATYVLDPRYTLIFSQQFDFDYGANIRSDITLIRKYHRMNYSFTYSADASLDRQAIVFGFWPQGVPELAIGQRRYTGLSSPAEY